MQPLHGCVIIFGIDFKWLQFLKQMLPSQADKICDIQWNNKRKKENRNSDGG